MVFNYKFDDEDFEYEVDNQTVADNLEAEFGIVELAEKFRDEIFDTLSVKEIDDLSESFGINVTKDNIVDLISGDSDYSWFLEDIVYNYEDVYEDEFDELKDIFEDEAYDEFTSGDYYDQSEVEKEWNSDYYKSRL